MSDSTILYSGIFCFTMILLGVTLTIQEFRKETQMRARLAEKTKE